VTHDPRRTPARPDLAAAHLKGAVEAERYAEATMLEVAVPVAPLTGVPDGNARLASQLLWGERFAAYEHDGTWAWGQAERDGYVGYVPRADLVPARQAATHRVAALLTHVYPAADLKSRPVGWLSYGAPIAIEEHEGRFQRLAAGGYVPEQHLARAAEPAADWVAEAERFLGAPYLWGGRTAEGLDCSGLVQLALHAAGRDCPRDSDMQAAELGHVLPGSTAPARGDLIFWKGHVGIMVDATRLLHCNGHHMATVIEPLAAARSRILGAGEGPVTTHVRLDGPAHAE